MMEPDYADVAREPRDASHMEMAMRSHGKALAELHEVLSRLQDKLHPALGHDTGVALLAERATSGDTVEERAPLVVALAEHTATVSRLTEQVDTLTRRCQL